MENFPTFFRWWNIQNRNLILRLVRCFLTLQVKINDFSLNFTEWIVMVNKDTEIDAIEHDLQIVDGLNFVIFRFLLPGEVEKLKVMEFYLSFVYHAIIYK